VFETTRRHFSLRPAANSNVRRFPPIGNTRDPHSQFYTLVSLRVVPATTWQAAVAPTGTFPLFRMSVALRPLASFDLYSRSLGHLDPIFAHLPALVMILGRPNEWSARPRVPAPAVSSELRGLSIPVAASSFDIVLIATLVFCSALLLWVTVTARRL